MRTPLSLLFATIALTAAIAACASDPNSKTGSATPVATVAIAPEVKLIAAPESEPEELPGIDTSELSPRERTAYWRWVSQLYAPCPDVAVSVAACVKESRACSQCVPAARFLAARARAGSASNEAIAAFTTRFGADVKKPDLADSPVRGPANAPVTIVVWSDFECPACGYAVPYLDHLLEEHAADIRLIHKLYPLKTHEHSSQAAHAALAAKKQGKYWEMEKLLFANQKALEDADLETYARKIGLDLPKYRKDYADPKADEIIERDRAEADKQGLTGTPFILINGREFDLAFFKLDRDLESWIVSEIEIARKDAERRAIAAVGAALTGEGRGPVGPLSSGAPAASAAPTVSATAAPSAAPAGGAEPKGTAPVVSATASPSAPPAPKKN